MPPLSPLETPLVLASAQLQRNTPAALAGAKSPLREASLELWRRRNTALDAIFYDLKVIEPAEAAALAPWLACEGALLIVPPSGAGSLRMCPDIEDFAQAGGARVRILAVAGVGSSALGTAAYARNVADAFGEPVAALVSGYGLADLFTEALGGWFWFGTLNRMRHAFEQLDDLTRGTVFDLSPDMPNVAHASLDTRTLCALLTDERFRFGLLTGHSKGNLVISEALYALREAGADGHLGGVGIVTVSAAIAMPPRYRWIVDVMGEADWFGAMNSNPAIEVEVRPKNAWHHTNTELAYHLPVREVMSALRRERGSALLQ
ncbi:hypothetical protein [Massilia sp. Leaf139]|uniref:hypothetical protein n=1 Tax=Massilia sp. Leaf139 TaxID=1736272 RepID=UPI0006FDFB06|nr:hypothetical protein [Massilia sp. Leaf139]KQQ96736.1 hypothetical protein ASF77_01685 [Massilia sp. Leaf139]